MSVLIDGQRLGAYRIVRLLGEGGMGAVYEARQEPLDRRVALKTLHAEHAKNQDSIARFFNEAKVLSRLEHPSIVQVSDFGYAADGTAYLVMEYLRGQSLAGRIRSLSERGQRLPIVTALQVCVQVADVLRVAHAQGIIHRDIKPDNLMLVADPVAPGGERVKVLDFGIAKLTYERSGVKTGTDQMMGTPAYMSPEQCAGAGGVDAQTDVYALGCVLYELVSGRRPFIADGLGLLIAMHMFEEPLPLHGLVPKLPKQLGELVHRMLRKDKTQRPTMLEVATELTRQLSRRTGSTEDFRPSLLVRTDSAESTASAIGSQASTIGRSSGQRIGRPTGTKARAMILIGSLVTLMVVAWFSLKPVGKVQPGASTTPQTVPETGKQTVAQKDLGVDASFSNEASPIVEAKEDPVVRPAAKQRTPTTAKSQSGGQTPQPGPKLLQKKRFGYEE